MHDGTIFEPGELLEGIILTESGGDPRAYRYEAHQDRAGRRDAPLDPDTADLDDGFLEDDTSYGLMQVMGTNARRLLGVPPGVRMRFDFMFKPVLNVSLGVQVLKLELAAVEAEVLVGRIPGGRVVERALARYNGGPTGDDLESNGDFRLQAYIDKVAHRTLLVRRDKGR